MRLTLTVISILFISIYASFAQTPPPSSTYKDSLTQCESAIVERSKKVSETYSSDVYRLKSQFQKEGDLEKAVSADKEWSRFLNQKSLTKGDVVDQL